MMGGSARDEYNDPSVAEEFDHHRVAPTSQLLDRSLEVAVVLAEL